MEHNHIIINSLGKIERRTAALSKYAILGALLSNLSKSELAAAISAPIRYHLDCQGITSRCFKVAATPMGALPVYDNDFDVTECITEKSESYDHDTIVINSRKRIGQRGMTQDQLNALAKAMVLPKRCGGLDYK